MGIIGPNGAGETVLARLLAGALEGYDGTVIAVSHDRYFLDRIADRIVEVRDGDVRAYEGGFSAWERARPKR